MPMLFSRKAPERVDERFSITASGGDITSVAEGAAFPKTDIREVGTQTISQVEYKEALPITKLMKRFDNYGAVQREAEKLGRRASISIDRLGAALLNNSDDTTLTWDGLSLANASHLIGDTGQTQSTIVTGALNKGNLNSAIVALANQNNHNNQEDPLAARYLVVPPALAMTAWELVESPGEPESANRNRNYINKQGINVVVWEQLTDTADAFLLSDKIFHGLCYLPAIEPTVEYVRDDNTGNYEYQMQYDVAVGVVDYRGFIKIDG